MARVEPMRMLLYGPRIIVFDKDCFVYQKNRPPPCPFTKSDSYTHSPSIPLPWTQFSCASRLVVYFLLPLLKYL